MDWVDRVRPTIQLTSPDGNQFEALWRNNNISVEKKLGIFDYPKVNGSIVQDLGIKGTRYPLTIYFDGVDHDLESQRFEAAFAERGPWTVIHPVLGEKRLQPIAVSPFIDPVESGSFTAFTTEWIEPTEQGAAQSTTELAASIEYLKDMAKQSGAEQFRQNVSQNTASETLAITSTTKKGLNAFSDSMTDLFENFGELDSEITSIYRGISDTITQSYIDVLTMAGQIQSLVELPGLITGDISARVNNYISFVEGIIKLSPEGTTQEDRNVVAVQEVFLSAAINGISLTCINGEYKTRTEVIQAIEDITNVFQLITDSLDVVQNNFVFKDLDEQYFSQSHSFTSTQLMVLQTIAFLLEFLFNLKIEKRFILDRARVPLEIAITEYGGPGKNDENIDLFIASNQLKGTEILLLPAGKEVVVYV